MLRAPVASSRERNAPTAQQENATLSIGSTSGPSALDHFLQGVAQPLGVLLGREEGHAGDGGAAVVSTLILRITSSR